MGTKVHLGASCEFVYALTAHRVSALGLSLQQ